MATVVRASGPRVTLTYNTIVDDVSDYWGNDLDTERIFPVGYWKIEKLLNNSPANEIAIHVSNMDNSGIADVEWLSHDPTNEPALTAAGTPPNDYYFIMTRTQWENFRPPAIISNKVVIFARLSKKAVGGVTTYKVFVNKSNIFSYNKVASVGPDGGGSGVDLP